MDDATDQNQRKFNQEQYDMLLRCSEKKDVSEWNEWRKTNPDVEILLERADLSNAHLEHADLRFAHLEGADLSNAHLERANLWGANLERADLSNAHLERAVLGFANLERADLIGANFEGADLRGADFSNANVTGARLIRRTKCRGIRVDSCHGSPRFKRQAMDQDFLEELQNTRWGKVKYYIWLGLADCGRSFWPILAWSLAFATFFAIIFCVLGPDAFDIENLPERNFVTMLYYSVVTFTTLGFGDVTPKTLPAAILVMVEVVLGYIMLGMLISVLANKVARRS